MEPTANTPANRKRIAWIVFQSTCAAVLPFLAASLYLVFTRLGLHRFTTVSDYCGLGAALFIGAVLVGTLPISVAARIRLLFAYIPLISFLLFIYSFYFIGMVFGDLL
jgi:hypothetical protein